MSSRALTASGSGARESGARELGARELGADPDPTPEDESLSQPWHRVIRTAEGAVLPVLLILVFVLFATLPATAGVFTTSANLRGIAINQAVILLAAIAVVPSISSGLYDLSVGASVGAGAIAAQGAARAALPLGAIVLVALLTCVLIGAVNGVLIAYLKINSLIATLGMSTIIAALVSWYTAGVTLSTPLPEPMVSVVNGDIAGIPRVLLLVLAVASAVYFLMQHTPLGRSFEALGSNASAARLVGLNVRLLSIGALVLTGLIAGIAALVITTQNGLRGHHCQRSDSGGSCCLGHPSRQWARPPDRSWSVDSRSWEDVGCRRSLVAAARFWDHDSDRRPNG
jgi:ribose/xylose/arabinose/galactoside ABC-type transport system permease subunit